MNDFLLWSLILAFSLFALIKSSDYFIKYAEKIGYFLGLPCFLIGVLILAVGTSLPELISSIVAVFKNSSEIVMGNVIGSNIANIFLVLGITAFFVNGLKVNDKSLKQDLILLFIVSLFLLFISSNNLISFYEGIILLICAFVYIFYSIKSNKREVSSYCESQKDNKIFKNSTLLIFTCYVLYIASDWTIISIIKLSDLLSLPKEFFAITALAIGTSLPELIVSISALKTLNTDMIWGNILGSCIFNTLIIVGVSAMFGNITVTNNILILAFPVLFLAITLLAINGSDGKISRTHSSIYLFIYVLFIIVFNLI